MDMDVLLARVINAVTNFLRNNKKVLNSLNELRINTSRFLKKKSQHPGLEIRQV